MGITRRLIEVTIQLAPGGAGTAQAASFDESGSDTVTISGARTVVRIQNNGTPVGSTASVDIYGLSPDLTNKLYTLGMVFNVVPRNKIVISAGDEQSGLSPVFGGFVTASYAQYDSSPDVPMHFECAAGLYDQVVPTQASSFTGPTQVETIFQGFARLMGLGFENSGVTGSLNNPYYSGNVKTQMLRAARDAGINADIINGSILAIWPKTQGRTIPQPIVIAPPPVGQMIGYPAFTNFEVVVKNVFDPRISYGQTFKLQTSVTALNSIGEWAINKMDLALDSLQPNGQWEQVIHAWNPKGPRPIVLGAS